MHVVLIRHPQTQASLEGRFPKKEESYSQKGWRQFEELRFQPVCGILITSDLPRCRELALAMGETQGIAVQMDPRIREIDMGIFAGYTFSELEEAFSQDVCSWLSEPENFTFPQGESYRDFHRRVREFADDLGEKTYTLVTHSGVIHFLMTLWMGKEVADVPFPCGHRVELFRDNERWEYFTDYGRNNR